MSSESNSVKVLATELGVGIITTGANGTGCPCCTDRKPAKKGARLTKCCFCYERVCDECMKGSKGFEEEAFRGFVCRNCVSKFTGTTKDSYKFASTASSPILRWKRLELLLKPGAKTYASNNASEENARKPSSGRPSRLDDFDKDCGNEDKEEDLPPTMPSTPEGVVIHQEKPFTRDVPAITIDTRSCTDGRQYRKGEQGCGGATPPSVYIAPIPSDRSARGGDHLPSVVEFNSPPKPRRTRDATAVVVGKGATLAKCSGGHQRKGHGKVRDLTSLWEQRLVAQHEVKPTPSPEVSNHRGMHQVDEVSEGVSASQPPEVAYKVSASDDERREEPGIGVRDDIDAEKDSHGGENGGEDGRWSVKRRLVYGGLAVLGVGIAGAALWAVSSGRRVSRR